MKKFFTSILLIAAFSLPWVTNARSLADYTYTTVSATDNAAPQVDSVTVILTINDTTMGYTTPAAGTYTFAVGNMVTAQAVAYEGYHFEGWNAMGMSIPINPLMLPIPAEAAGLTIPVTAVFAPDSVAPQTDSVTFTLAVNDPAMGFTTPAPGVQTIAVGEDVVLTAVPFNGYHFVAWEASVMGETDRNNENPVEIAFDIPIPAGIDITVTAIFAPDSVEPMSDSVSFTLAVNDPEMGFTTPAPGVQTIAVGEDVVLTAVPFNGYHFVAWEASVMGETERTYENPVEIGFDEPLPAGIDLTLTAIFAPDSIGPMSDSVSFTLAVNDPTMGTIDPAPGVHTIAVGDEITLTATPFAGYHFVAWEASVMGETERTDENPVEIGFDFMPEGIDIVLTAIFAPDSTQGISTASSAQCRVYPNPADDATTISVTGVNGKVSIAVVDMNGRTVASETMECAADCAKTLNVANLAQGAYFVRITGESVSMVKKLVVR